MRYPFTLKACIGGVLEKRDDRWIISVLSRLQAKPLMVHQMRISLVHVSSSESAEGRSSNVCIVSVHHNF